MARGIKKHMKRIAAPPRWMLDKMTGVYAPKPSPGPHKLSESLPLIVFLRNQLKYALTAREVTMITHQRLIKVDGKVRTDECYPLGFMDVVSIDKTKEHFRILYSTKRRFVPHKIREEEAGYKLCRVNKVVLSAKKIPYATTHDGRTIRYIHPEVKANDTLRIDIKTGKVLDWLKLENGMLVYITGGHNLGRIGTMIHREKHPGSVEIVHVKDARGHAFATRLSNIFVIGKPNNPFVSLHKDKGIRDSIVEDRQKRLQKQSA